ncbi:beta-hexosaminidase 3-like, partial [Aristolochia californica]|uniref:beta-hexosaminidase 3-like n=1 Tax=Aristolochia californica TaxID=171875 RepID=UPI0035DB3E33
FFFSLGFLLAVCAVFAEAINLWPMPKSVSHGSTSLYLSKEFGFSMKGSGYKDDGFSRFVDVVDMAHVVDGDVSGTAVLAGLDIALLSSNDKVCLDNLDRFMRLHKQFLGLSMAYSQLYSFNFTTRVFEVHLAPWIIADKPRFPYRGLLIDTARHYIALPKIKHVIDAMAYSNTDVLHWHIVDTESFPLEIPSYPKLWNGAYSLSERYTVADADEIVLYAERRGINVLAELDVPGHARSWGFGYSSLWTSSDCQQPLDVSNEFTFQVISGILSDFSKIFNFKFVHLGGDEVNTSCWRTTPYIREWLKKERMSESQAYQYFVLRAQKIAESHGYEAVSWEETFNDFGNRISPPTVVHNWLGGDVAKKVVEAGLKCIVSNQDKWYLDHLDTPWQDFYMNEPLTNITDPKRQKLVIGGEVCMWGETADASDLEQTIWPRAAAAAERLWTTYKKLAKDPRQVAARLARFRCLLNERGVAAAPLAGPGRTTPCQLGFLLQAVAEL